MDFSRGEIDVGADLPPENQHLSLQIYCQHVARVLSERHAAESACYYYFGEEKSLCRLQETNKQPGAEDVLFFFFCFFPLKQIVSQ